MILPTQNPDGREADTRRNANGFDMNRDWFARTQPETDGKVELLRRFPGVLFIDAHEFGGTDDYFFPPNADPVYHDIADPAVDWINDIYGAAMQDEFEQAYKRRFSFLMPTRALVVEAVSVEALGRSEAPPEALAETRERTDPLRPAGQVGMFGAGEWRDTGVYRRADVQPGDIIKGPAIVAENNATTVVEAGWQAEVTPYNHLVLTRVEALPQRRAIGSPSSPTSPRALAGRRRTPRAPTTGAIRPPSRRTSRPSSGKACAATAPRARSGRRTPEHPGCRSASGRCGTSRWPLGTGCRARGRPPT